MPTGDSTSLPTPKKTGTQGGRKPVSGPNIQSFLWNSDYLFALQNLAKPEDLNLRLENLEQQLRAVEQGYANELSKLQYRCSILERALVGMG